VVPWYRQYVATPPEPTKAELAQVRLEPKTKVVVIAPIGEMGANG